MSSLHCPAIEQLEASLCDVQVQTFCAARGKRGVRVLGGPWVSAWGDLKRVRYRQVAYVQPNLVWYAV